MYIYVNCHKIQLSRNNCSLICFTISLISIFVQDLILNWAELDTLRIKEVKVEKIEIYFLSLECFASRLGLAAAAEAAATVLPASVYRYAYDVGSHAAGVVSGCFLCFNFTVACWSACTSSTSPLSSRVDILWAFLSHLVFPQLHQRCTQGGCCCCRRCNKRRWSLLPGVNLDCCVWLRLHAPRVTKDALFNLHPKLYAVV